MRCPGCTGTELAGPAGTKRTSAEIPAAPSAQGWTQSPQETGISRPLLPVSQGAVVINPTGQHTYRAEAPTRGRAPGTRGTGVPKPRPGCSDSRFTNPAGHKRNRPTTAEGQEMPPWGCLVLCSFCWTWCFKTRC